MNVNISTDLETGLTVTTEHLEAKLIRKHTYRVRDLVQDKIIYSGLLSAHLYDVLESFERSYGND